MLTKFKMAARGELLNFFEGAKTPKLKLEIIQILLYREMFN